MDSNKSKWRQAFLATYQRLSLHYGATFLRSGSESMHKGHASHWQLYLHTERIGPDEMEQATSDLIRSSMHREFPPNPAQFVAYVHRMRAESRFRIPDPDEAFKQACGLSLSVHPLTSYVRRQLGGWYMRTQSDPKIRGRFFDLYSEATTKLLRGEIALDDLGEKNPSEQASRDPKMPPEELVSRIGQLLSPTG